jgi:hypothetical protein
MNEVRVASNGVRFRPNFVKTGVLLQTLKTHTMAIHHTLTLFLKRGSTIKMLQ